MRREEKILKKEDYLRSEFSKRLGNLRHLNFFHPNKEKKIYNHSKFNWRTLNGEKNHSF